MVHRISIMIGPCYRPISFCYEVLMSYEIYAVTPDILHTGIHPTAQQLIQHFLRKLEYYDFFQGRIECETYGMNNANASNEHLTPTFTENSAKARISYSLQSDSLRWTSSASAHEYQRMINTTGMFTGYRAVFQDVTNQILLHHYETPLSVAVELYLDFEDVVLATGCIQRLRSFTSAELFEYNLDYTYILPMIILGPLFALYKQMGNAPEDFVPYLSEHSNKQIVVITNRHDMKDKAVGVRTTKARLVSSVEHVQDVPEKLGDDTSPNGYRVIVNLHTQMCIPNLMALTYPLFINNQQIPRGLIPVNPSYVDTTLDSEHPFHSVTAFKDELYAPKSYQVKHFPWYDNWEPPTIPGYKPVIVGAFTLDDIETPGSSTTIDLMLAYGAAMDAAFFILMKQIYDRMLDTVDLINITVYQNKVMISQNLITLSDELILTVQNLDPKAEYHLVISYCLQGRVMDRSLRILNGDIIAKRNLL